MIDYQDITKRDASQRKSNKFMKLNYKLCLLRPLRRSVTETRAKPPESKSAASSVQHILSSHIVSTWNCKISDKIQSCSSVYLLICSFV